MRGMGGGFGGGRWRGGEEVRRRVGEEWRGREWRRGKGENKRRWRVGERRGVERWREDRNVSLCCRAVGVERSQCLGWEGVEGRLTVEGPSFAPYPPPPWCCCC